MTYLEEIHEAMKTRHTEEELRRHYYLGTGHQVPYGVDVREHVAHWHADQQAINAGAEPSEFWKKCVYQS